MNIHSETEKFQFENLLHLFYFFCVCVCELNSPFNEDPNQQAYQGESHHISDNNEQSNSINHNDAEEEFGFDTNLFDKPNEVESDDFYGRTREIIIFAKKGKIINKQIKSITSICLSDNL